MPGVVQDQRITTKPDCHRGHP